MYNEQDQAFNSIKEEGSGWETARTIIETGGVSFETTEQGLIGAQRLANRIGGTSSQILRGGAATEFTGYGLTALSAVSTIMNAETKYGHLRTSDKVDLAIDAATTVTEISLSALEVTTPVGWIIGGSLFVGNLISEHYNHESLTEWLFN